MRTFSFSLLIVLVPALWPAAPPAVTAQIAANEHAIDSLKSIGRVIDAQLDRGRARKEAELLQRTAGFNPLCLPLTPAAVLMPCPPAAARQ